MQPFAASDSTNLAPEALEARADEVSRLLALMANPKRLLILCKLLEGDMTVGTLAATVGLGQSALSQHLAKLRAADIVSTRRQAQSITYSLASDEVRVLMATLYDLFCVDRSV